MADLKARIEEEISTMKSAIASLGYLHIDEEKSKQLLELFEGLKEREGRVEIQLTEEQKMDAITLTIAIYKQELENSKKHMNFLRDRIQSFKEENAKLINAITETINDNLHLADGDNCTLRALTRVLKELGIKD